MSKTCRNCGATTPRIYCPACEFMTPKEVMARLAISEPTFYRWVKAGYLKPKAFGPRKRLLRAEVEALVA